MSSGKWTIVTGIDLERNEKVVLFKAPTVIVSSETDLVSTRIMEINADRVKLHLLPYSDVQISELTQKETVERGLIEKVKVIIFH
jgi:hypothetical protein